MGILFSFAFKVIKYLLILLLVIFTFNTTLYSLTFLATNTELSLISSILTLGLILKILLDISIYIYQRKVKSSGVFQSLVYTAVIDILILIFAYVIVSLVVTTNTIKFITNKQEKYRFIKNEIETFLSSDPLSDFQNNLMLYIQIYVVISLVIVFLLNRKVHKLK